MYHKSIFLSLLLFFISSIFMMGFSQNTEKGQRVAVFKNGTGFFFNPMVLKAEKEGEQKGKFIVKSLPDALFGTFWFYTNGKPISSLKSYESEESGKKEKATTLHEMLYGNIGENVEITLNSTKESEITGKIQNVNLQTGMLFLETTKPKVGFMVIAINEIKAISFTKTPNTEFSPTSKKRIIEVEIDKASSQENVEMAYLQRGIGWLPSYLINLKDDKKAQIILRAEVVNDAEDIKDATLSLVVGVPNFKYDRLVSPFVSNQDLESFLNQLNGNSGNYYSRQNMAMSNQIMSQSASYGGAMEMDAYGGGGNTDEIETQSQEDLFFYTKNGVSLPKGGRALYSLFSDEVDYKHIYEVQLPQNNGYNVVYKQDNEQKNDVYHSLELTNSTDFPWTTGTAMVTQPRKTKEGTVSATADPQVLSQDMLKYTARTSKSMLRLTIAPDIMVKDNEQETERETDIKKQKIIYDLVKATATIEVKNYKDKEVTLKVSRTITGEMLKTDSDWENKKRPNYYAINPINDVTWEVKLAKGESKTITYSYQFYVRK